MLSGALALGGKFLSGAGTLGSKITKGMLGAANTVENAIPMVANIPGYQLTKNAIGLGSKVADYATRVGEALQEPTLKAGLSKLAPIMRDVQKVYQRGQSATSPEGFIRSELERN